MPEVISLADKFAQFEEHWRPYNVAALNGQVVKLAKLKGEFVWHHHEAEDALFLVVKGRLKIELRDGDLWLEAGEFAVIPRGVEHRPVAAEECHVLLLEPAGTLNTGNVRSDHTVEDAWL